MPHNLRQLVFQSTLLREERRVLSLLVSIHHIHFNPRSYERSDRSHHHLPTQYMISIHAPTRGATRLGFNINSPSKISIHAPTRGATRKLERDSESNKISIHAPTRGATRCHSLRLHSVNISIHAPTRGATRICRNKNIR